jgi:pSer/pThr/pTyr-binding forkhead associated (FHA) protein
MSVMTTATLDRRTAPAASTEAHEPVGILGHSARRGSLSFESPAPGRYLAIEEGEITRLVPLHGPVTHVGRGFSADIRLDHQSVSRRHAVLVAHPHGTRILDDRSANGTFVNGQRVTDATVQHRDTIELGAVALVFVEVT